MIRYTRVRIFLAIILCAFLCVSTGCFSYTSSTSLAEETTVPLIDVDLNVKCEQNLIFARYDVEIKIDGKKVGVLKHGSEETYTLRLEEGEHFFVAHKDGDTSVEGSETFTISRRTRSISCQLLNHVKKVEIKSFNIASEPEETKATETATTEEPATEEPTEAPTTTEAPTITEAPTTTEEPTEASTTTEAPTTTEEPTTTEAPTTTTVEPTTTAAPTTTADPHPMPVMSGTNVDKITEVATRYGLKRVFADANYGDGTYCRTLQTSDYSLSLELIYNPSTKEILYASIYTGTPSTAAQRNAFFLDIAPITCPSKDSQAVKNWVAQNYGKNAEVFIGGFQYIVGVGQYSDKVLFYISGEASWEDWQLSLGKH